MDYLIKRPLGFVLTSIIFMVLFGCSEAEVDAPKQTKVKLVKSEVIGQKSLGLLRDFPARVVAAQRAELSFRVSGRITQLNVKEGQKVNEGQILATLDDTRYKLDVAESKADFENVQADYLRALELIKDNYIAKTDVDKLKSQTLRAKAVYESAVNELSYTQLRSPFAGVVAQRMIQNFEEIQAKQPVFSIQNADNLELKIQVPEKMIKDLREGDALDNENDRLNDVPVFAYFDDDRENPYPLQMKEVATKADADTQTFEVTFTMQRPENRVILSGMTAHVVADFTLHSLSDTRIHLPISAVVSSDAHEPHVWVVDEDNRVRARKVSTSTMAGESIVVTDGLEVGERVVTAGAAFLTEGMQVSLMPTIDQAQ